MLVEEEHIDGVQLELVIDGKCITNGKKRDPSSTNDSSSNRIEWHWLFALEVLYVQYSVRSHDGEWNASVIRGDKDVPRTSYNGFSLDLVLWLLENGRKTFFFIERNPFCFIITRIAGRGGSTLYAPCLLYVVF